jgi:hypothetical protein
LLGSISSGVDYFLTPVDRVNYRVDGLTLTVIVYYCSLVAALLFFSSAWLIGLFKKLKGNTITAYCVVTVGLLTQHCLWFDWEHASLHYALGCVFPIAWYKLK